MNFYVMWIYGLIGGFLFGMILGVTSIRDLLPHLVDKLGKISDSRDKQLKELRVRTDQLKAAIRERNAKTTELIEVLSRHNHK